MPPPLTSGPVDASLLPPPAEAAGSGWLTRVILGADPARHVSLKITLGGQLGYACNLGLIWYFVSTGLMDPQLAWPVTWAVVASMLTFYMLLRTGWSRRCADPGLTLAQMVNAGVFSALGYVVAPKMHIGLLMPVAVTLSYSVFALRGPQVRQVQVITMAIFVCTSAAMCYLQPQFYQPYIEFYVVGALGVTVVMLTWLGSRLAQMRARLRRQREELTAMLERIEKLASRDSLTGLHNRRHMNMLLAHHAERTRRGGACLTLALIDLDHFKQVNDTHGHGVGDEVLQAFAKLMLAGLPGTDAVARWGGEEFMLLSTAAPAEVLAFLQRVRAQLQQAPASLQAPTLRVNFSAGVAVYRPDERIIDALQRADQALYEAKRAGRAQSRVAPAASAGSQTPALPADMPRSCATAARPMPPRGANVAPTRSLLTTAQLASSPDELAVEGESTLEGTEHDAAHLPGDRRLPLAWLLGHEPRQRAWTARSMVGGIPYLFGILTALYAVHAVDMAADTAWKIALGLALTQLTVYAMVRSGWTARLEDPTITWVQVVAAITWTAVLYVTTSHMHAVQLIFLALLVTISVCNMRRGQAWTVCLYAMTLMTAAMWTMSRLSPHIYVPEVELGNWILMMFDLPTLMLMGKQLSSLHVRLRQQRVQLKDAVARLRQLATHDELTGLHNRTYMQDMLAHYRRRGAQADEVFTVVLIDLDHFKQINDQYGHAVGDDVLQAFAWLASSTLREVDMIARWGGEEFLALLPQTTPAQGAVGIERLRQAFANLEVSSAVPQLRASFSAGLAAFHGEDAIEKVLACADEALYCAKHAGRNRACVHEPDQPALSAALQAAVT